MTDTLTRPATPTDGMPGATDAGERGFIAPDGTRIVVKLTNYDLGLDTLSGTHVALGVTTWEVDETGAHTGLTVAGWVHTAPIDVIASGQTTLPDIVQLCEDTAVTRILDAKNVKAQLASLNLAPLYGTDTSTAAPSSIS